MQLRDYQTAAVAETQRLIAEVPGANPAIVISTGGGKTVCMGHLTAQYQPTHYQAAIAHRRELVSQIALAYAKYKIPHRIIGPSTTVQECRRAQLEELGYTYVDQSARVGVCSVDTLAARDMTGDAWARSVAIAHMDEFHHCFPAGTLVDGRDIASLKVGDVVTAFDEKTGELHQRTVTHTFKNVAPKYMVRVTTAHHSVECTLSHPFWTQRGWVKAGELNDADYVCAVPNGIHAGEIQHPISVGEGGHRLLREQQMRVGVENGNPETQAARQGCPGSVLGMRDGVRSVRLDSDPLEEGRAGVLQQSVLVGVSPPHLLRDDGAHESQVRLGANDESQPDDEGRVPSENDRVHAGQGAESPGRERTTSNEGRGNADANVRAVGLCGAIDLQNGPQRPNALQDRLRPSVPENRNRSGRVLPQHQSAESAGRPQGCAPDRCRVESVQIYESADSGGAFDGHVYNIEVSDLHTYTANGVVVHNCLRDNKWGKALESFPSLKNVIGYTATPRRADRKGLGRHAQGIASHLVEGPAMHELMAAGYLTPYKLVTGAVSDIDLTTVSVAASGDYNPQKLRGAMKKSRQIVGDAVAIYQRYCPQSKAVLFACDVEDAGRYREAFTAAGIPAEIVTAETREDVRRDVMKRFKTGALQVLVNVDLFGEGFDLPAIETVIMCRPTKSLPLYQQQFGRGLRLMLPRELMKQWHLFTPEERRAHIAASAKPHAWIIDLVRNWAEPSCGGLPDARGRVWSLDGAERSGKGPSDVPPVRACTNPEPISADGMMCTGVYERFLTACPQCGYAPVPTGRTIEQVDGDVTLVDEETLARLRGEYLEAHTTPHYGGPHAAANYARHRERFEALSAVRQAMEWWGPFYEAEQGRKLTDREQMKAFYLTFGVTTLEAVSLRRADADSLRKKVIDWMELKGFTIPA